MPLTSNYTFTLFYHLSEPQHMSVPPSSHIPPPPLFFFNVVVLNYLFNLTKTWELSNRVAGCYLLGTDMFNKLFPVFKG